MIVVKRSLFILAGLLLTMTAIGQESLSLSGALERALASNYGLIISRADLEVARINNNWGNAGRYPTIGFDASDNTVMICLSVG